MLEKEETHSVGHANAWLPVRNLQNSYEQLDGPHVQEGMFSKSSPRRLQDGMKSQSTPTLKNSLNDERDYASTSLQISKRIFIFTPGVKESGSAIDGHWC